MHLVIPLLVDSLLLRLELSLQGFVRLLRFLAIGASVPGCLQVLLHLGHLGSKSVGLAKFAGASLDATNVHAHLISMVIVDNGASLFKLEEELFLDLVDNHGLRHTLTITGIVVAPLL